MAEQSERKLLPVVIVWLVIISIGVGVYKFVIAPKEKEEIIDQTGTPSQYKHKVRVGIDSFAGTSLYPVRRATSLR